MKALILTITAAVLVSCTATYKQTAAGDIEFNTTIIPVPVEEDSKK